MTEKEKYFALLKERAKNGLRDVKFCTANIFDVSEDAAYSELNRLHAASDLPDPDVLGKYSPKQ